MFKSLFTFLIASTVSLAFAMTDENIPAKPVEIGIQTIENSGKIFLALNFKNYPEWHTYWKNPGDAGLALSVLFYKKNKEIKVEASEWPIPKKFVEPGDQWAFGYSGEYTLFYELKKDFQNQNFGKEITAKLKWLVCKNICVPGSLEIPFTVSRNGLKASNPNLMPDYETQTLVGRLINLPKNKDIPSYLDINLSKGTEEKTLVLSYEFKNTTDGMYFKNSNLAFLFPQLPFDFKHEKISIGKTSITGILPISWDGEYQDPPAPLSPDGKFKKPYTLKFLINDPIAKESYIVEKKFTSFNTTPVAIVSNNIVSPGAEEKKNDTNKLVEVNSSSSIFYYLVLAFFGGLILNIMPCVLPVISIKLFGLIKYQKESKSRIFKHNLFYTLGILFTFTILAFLIVLLKQFGTVVGWGFQLQSPNFISIMIIALFIFSLNLFGMFEFMTPGGHKIGNLKTEDGFYGDFLGGVLATILSTPCSAPFLGTALTFAFTSSTSVILAIFLMIGLGLASPFIITGIFPALVSFLPKPGNWMNTLKKLLGVTLILTIFWLLDVYNTLVGGQNQFIKLLTILLFIFVGFLLKKKEKWIGAVSFLIGSAIFINILNTEVIVVKDENSSLIRDKQAKGLNWEPWTLDKMEEHAANRNVVFMDFTAKWCFTCKVNEKLVLDTDEFKNLVKEKNLKLLIADWTKRDEVIGNFLMKNKLVGVPAYFIQKEDGTLISLGETISIPKIRENL
jgi:thiol:disulfide interchange protein DsbD